MRVRSIEFRDFRAFRGRRHISFVEPWTKETRLCTVIAGSNGTGKTTIFEVIEALLAFVIYPEKPNRIVEEAKATGYIALELELGASDLSGLGDASFRSDVETVEILHIFAGRRDKGPQNVNQIGTNLYGHIVQPGQGQPVRRKSLLADRLRKAILAMQQRSDIPLHGGFLFLPHDRRLIPSQGGSIEPPPAERPWAFRFESPQQWKGTLEQHWVWQNYLDLERQTSNRSQLKPFIQAIEEALGPNRQIIVREGRVLINPAWSPALKRQEPTLVHIHDLPSGEQQLLLILGELVRRARHGAVVMVDEPELSLHPTLQRVLLDFLRRYARQWGAQLILATHSLELMQTVHSDDLVNLDQLSREQVEADRR